MFNDIGITITIYNEDGRSEDNLFVVHMDFPPSSLDESVEAIFSFLFESKVIAKIRRRRRTDWLQRLLKSTPDLPPFVQRDDRDEPRAIRVRTPGVSLREDQLEHIALLIAHCLHQKSLTVRYPLRFGFVASSRYFRNSLAWEAWEEEPSQ